jgi:hypothetical protein
MNLNDDPFPSISLKEVRAMESQGKEPDWENEREFYDGISMTCAELADELNAMIRGEIPVPRPCERVEGRSRPESHAEIENDFGLDGEDEESSGRETGFETLPEMDIIIANEGIL